MPSASPATIDRLPASVRGVASGRKKCKTATKQSKQVPIRTFADWNGPPPGLPEIDFVSHGGSSVQGAFLWSLAATDVCSGWTEAVPPPAREQSPVVEGLEAIRRQSPIPILGIDSDNDGAFVNDALLAYRREHGFEFTRSRAYRKNDQAWIGQKNGAVVRRFVGYDRLSGMTAGQCLAQLFQVVRLYVNHFRPSFKLRSRTRVGATVRKAYYKPATPCERLPAHASVAEAAKEKPRSEGGRLDPLELLHRIREAQAALVGAGVGRVGRRAGAGEPGAVPGEAPRAMACGGGPPDASGRGSPSPLLPDAEGSLRGRLGGHPPAATGRSRIDGQIAAGAVAPEHPGRFPDGRLRTLQRRIREWRRATARELVYACLEGERAAEVPSVIGADGEG